MAKLLSALLRMIRCASPSAPPHAATPRRPETFRSPEENFQAMRLMHRHFAVDDGGRWWRIETRRCPWTGLVLRETRRITD